ncbi:MAG: cyanase [Deltaproteobacteria bacterium]|nr:cyanase [Deltaproteobacteria bacterium]
MEICKTTEMLLKAKEEKKLSFAAIGKGIGRSEMFVSALFHGQAQATAAEAGKIVAKLGLGKNRKEVVSFLVAFPNKGLGPVVPTDPLIYRLYEIMQVYGHPFKAIVHEKFGDGIMSAIDFTMDVEREKDPKGDRVKVTMSGKYLPYKIW